MTWPQFKASTRSRSKALGPSSTGRPAQVTVCAAGSMVRSPATISVLAVVGVKMLTHSCLKSVLGPNFNLYLLLVVLGILALGVLASWLHRGDPETAPGTPAAKPGPETGGGEGEQPLA